MQTLAALLRAGIPFSTAEVAARYEVQRKTIQRDLKFMRDRLGYEFEYRPSLHRFVLTNAPIAVL